MREFKTAKPYAHFASIIPYALTLLVCICTFPYAPQDQVLSTLQDWLSDSACNRNTTVLLIAGQIYAHEGNYPEALKACHNGATLEQ